MNVNATLVVLENGLPTNKVTLNGNRDAVIFVLRQLAKADIGVYPEATEGRLYTLHTTLYDGLTGTMSDIKSIPTAD